jgi:hypothetical protein
VGVEVDGGVASFLLDSDGCSVSHDGPPCGCWVGVPHYSACGCGLSSISFDACARDTIEVY